MAEGPASASKKRKTNDQGRGEAGASVPAGFSSRSTDKVIRDLEATVARMLDSEDMSLQEDEETDPYGEDEDEDDVDDREPIRCNTQ